LQLTRVRRSCLIESHRLDGDIVLELIDRYLESTVEYLLIQQAISNLIVSANGVNQRYYHRHQKYTTKTIFKLVSFSSFLCNWYVTVERKSGS
jgi:hypothetical protein